jgi:hypothetical protein
VSILAAAVSVKFSDSALAIAGMMIHAQAKPVAAGGGSVMGGGGAAQRATNDKAMHAAIVKPKSSSTEKATIA